MNKAIIPSRCDAARDPNTSIETLTELSKDEYWEVRANVAANPNTPAGVLHGLINTDNDDVCYYVAANPNTPADILVRLAENEDTLVRQEIMYNPNTPEAVKLWVKNGGFAGMTLAEFIDICDSQENGDHPPNLP